MKQTDKQGAIAPDAVTISNGINIQNHESELQILSVSGISEPTKKWLIALGMSQDLRDYVWQTEIELKKDGRLIKSYDKDLIKAINSVNTILNKYLTDQIRLSILGFGDDNLCETGKI